jgi:ABC-type phosphate transport system permease subunit
MPPFPGGGVMLAFGHIVALTAPLFLLVLLGYSLSR